MSKAIVSTVKLKDINKAGDYLYKAIKSSPTYKDHNLNKDKIKRTLADSIYDPLKCSFIMIDKKKIVGMLGGYVNSSWFSTDRVLYDMGIYIDEEYRGTGAAKKLFIEWFQYADDLKVDEIVFSCTADKEYYQKMYEVFTKKFGFELMGVYLRKRK